MQVDSFTYSNGRWSVDPLPTADGDSVLVLVFGDSSFLDTPAPFDDLRAHYPKAVIGGCSTGGQILETEINEGTLTVAVVRFEGTQLRTVWVDCKSSDQSQAAGDHIAQTLKSDALQAVLVFSDGLTVNGTTLVGALNKMLDNHTSVSGGLAGDGSRFESTWVLHDGKPCVGAVTAIGLYGDAIRVGHGSRGGWDRFGPERVITRSKGPVLYELDGQPALALYKKYLGERAAGLPATGLLFPLSIRSKSGENEVVRTILSIDESEQSLTFAGDIPSGWRARLMTANFDRLIDGAARAGNQATMGPMNTQPVLSIAISCIGRRLVLGERAEDEVEAAYDALAKGSTQIGFYSYGEISPTGLGNCQLQNQTMTITTLSETMK